MVLDGAVDFTVRGRTVNLNVLGEAATATLTGVPPSAAEFAESASISVPFSGAIRRAAGFPKN